MLNNVGFTFGSDWDNVSVAMDPTTLTATRQATSLILATQPHEISILRKVRERGGVILYNGAPVTTSWARAFKPADAMYFAEDGEQCRVRFLHLSTPIALTRYSGGDSDIDPKYNATCAGTSDVSTCLAANIIANLDYGVLPFLCAHRPSSLASLSRSLSLALTRIRRFWPDDGLFKNGTGANVLEHIFPIEVLRIEPGTVWGTDRIVTSKSGEPFCRGAFVCVRCRLSDGCEQGATGSPRSILPARPALSCCSRLGRA